MRSCDLPYLHCPCRFHPRMISILFLNLIEAVYTVDEERLIRRIIVEGSRGVDS